jgi:hypothetical protein
MRHDRRKVCHRADGRNKVDACRSARRQAVELGDGRIVAPAGIT